MIQSHDISLSAVSNIELTTLHDTDLNENIVLLSVQQVSGTEICKWSAVHCEMYVQCTASELYMKLMLFVEITAKFSITVTFFYVVHGVGN